MIFKVGDIVIDKDGSRGVVEEVGDGCCLVYYGNSIRFVMSNKNLKKPNIITGE